MENKLPENCNQCHNACPADALKCGRGRDYFAALERGETPPERQLRAESSDPLVRALSACGRTAEHIRERFQANGTEERELYSCLTQEEQEELLRLLEKLNQTWQAEREKHHGSGERGDRRKDRERGARRESRERGDRRESRERGERREDRERGRHHEAEARRGGPGRHGR